MRYITLFLVFLFFNSSAQVTFSDGTKSILGNESIFSTVPIAIDDLNGDLKDDIILLDRGQSLCTSLQNGKKNLPILQRGNTVSVFGDLSIITGDLDNDGIPEIISSGTENGSEVLKNVEGEYVTVQFTTDIYSQNSNLVDINSDGYLDFFICNDVGESLFYINDGSGQLTQESIINFQVSAEDDMSGNYSSIFTDINQDGFPDLYIGKCRAGVDDPTDPRRVNTLYINNGNGTFTERAKEYGLAIGAQSWSVDAGDVDNDGDTDMLITNHDAPHDLMINNGDGTFSRFNALPDRSASFAYQSFFADFDNNGWLDIFITEPSNSYILYNDEMSFSIRDISHNNRRPFSGATGDLNNDGFLDLYISFPFSFQNPSNKKDVVLFNDRNTNNYLTLVLEGVLSNRDAVGAKIRLHYEGNQQYREVIVGKSYGIMNTTNVHFGLGKVAEIDSLIVEWPSGEKTKLDSNIPINSKLTIVEDGCINNQLFIPDFQLCNGEPISIEVDDFDSYLWSDGSQEQTLIVAEENSYQLQVIKEGCRLISNFFNIEKEQIYHPDQIITSEETVGCNLNTITLHAPEAQSYQWSSGETSQTIDAVPDEIYSVEIITNCGTYSSSELQIENVEISTEVQGDTVKPGEFASVFIEGGDVAWYQYKNDIDVLSTSNEYEFGPIMNDTTIYAGYRESGTLFNDRLLTQIPLNEELADTYPNDTLSFLVFNEIDVKSIQVRTQKSGKRTVEMYQNGSTLWQSTIELDQGINTIELDIALDRGNYQLTTNVDTNITYLNSNHPQLSIQNLQSFDDEIRSYIAMNGSSSEEAIIPYFFNWNIDYGIFDCEERYPVGVVADDTVNSILDVKVNFEVYPSLLLPNQPIVVKVSENQFLERVSIYNNRMTLISEVEMDKTNLISPHKSGIYYLEIVLSDGRRGIKQIVVIE